MGSFDVGCGISNLAVHYGDKVGFVIIDRSTGTESDFWKRRRGTAMHIYSSDMYQAMFPPVFATYDDYGSVRDVEKSTTTDLIESFFRRPMKVVIDCINENRGIYDTYSPIYKNYAIEGSLLDSYTASLEEKLLSVGFVRDTESNERAISYFYGDYRVIHYPQEHKALLSDQKTGKILDGHIFARDKDAKSIMKSFAKNTGIYPGYEADDIEVINILHNASGMFFLKDVYDGMEKAMIAENAERTYFRDYYAEDWEKFMERLESVPDWTVKKELSTTYSSDIYSFIKRYSVMPEAVIGMLGVYRENREEFFKMRYLSSILTQVNRMLMPSYCGEQHGNDEASQRLNDLTNEILKVRAEDY